MYEYRVIEIGPARRRERQGVRPNGPDIQAILNEHAAEGYRLVQVLTSGDRPHMGAQMLVLEREMLNYDYSPAGVAWWLYGIQTNESYGGIP